MDNPYVVVEHFFDGADALRTAFEAHFHNPHHHTRQHQVWNYWYVPDSYTYLRTDPGKIIPEPLVDQFMQRLNSWGAGGRPWALGSPYKPWLSPRYVGNGGRRSTATERADGLRLLPHQVGGAELPWRRNPSLPPGKLLGNRAHQDLGRRYVVLRSCRRGSTNCSSSTIGSSTASSRCRGQWTRWPAGWSYMAIWRRRSGS